MSRINTYNHRPWSLLGLRPTVRPVELTSRRRPSSYRRRAAAATGRPPAELPSDDAAGADGDDLKPRRLRWQASRRSPSPITPSIYAADQARRPWRKICVGGIHDLNINRAAALRAVGAS